MKIRYVAPALCPDGYGEFARHIVWALHHAGHELSVSTFLHNASEPPERFGEKGLLAAALLERPLPAPDVNIVNATPHSFEEFRIPSTLNIGFTMYEAEHISESAVMSCNRMDAVFVPSRWNQQIFRQHGVTVPVFVVRPPWTRLLPPPRRRVREPFTFYSVFEWRTPHKDPYSLVAAYCRAFTAKDDVLLRVKTFERGAKGAIESEIRQWQKSFGNGALPEIELVLGSMGSDELWQAHSGADCYVSSHHGEGWGMPIWEAMAAGLPAISTGFGANLEFMQSSNSYLVDFAFDREKRWANVNVAELAAMMRHVYSSPKAKEVARLGRASVLACTADKTVGSIVDAVGQLTRPEAADGLPEEPLLGRQTGITPAS